MCADTHTHSSPDIHTHTHLVGQSEVAFSRAFSLISAQMSENFPEFRLTDYTTPKEQNFKGGTRKFAMFSEFNGPNIKIYSFFFIDTQDVKPLLKHYERHWIISKCVCVLVDRGVCVCVCGFTVWTLEQRSSSFVYSVSSPCLKRTKIRQWTNTPDV